MAILRFFRRGRRDEDAAREIASYIGIETDDNIARGMTPQAAHDAAVRKFGNATHVREDIYWMNTIRPVETIWQDLKFAARLLKRDKGFAAAAILSLALGIGANTAIFQLLDAVRLRTLPVEQPEELVNISFAPGSNRNGRFSSRWPALTWSQVEEIQRRQQVFSGMAAWSSGMVNTSPGGEVRNVDTLWAGGDLFRVLGVKASIGRVLLPEDDRPGCGSPVAVISHAYWQRAYGGAEAALGQTVRLQNVQFPIVGVTEPSFFGLEVGRQYDVAIPLCADPLIQTGTNRFESRRDWWLAAVGRLLPGRTRAQANEHLIALSPALVEATLPQGYSDVDRKDYLGFKLNALPSATGVSDVRDDFGQPLVVLLAATGLVLLIACANLANLLLARATAREREIAVRLSIGASRRRIATQLVVESVLLAVVGAALGLVVARGLTTLLVSQLAGGMAGLYLDLAWNLPVFAFTAAVSLIACLLFGLAPAVKATAFSPALALKAGGRGVTEGRERFSARRVLVVTQVALSLVLMVGALLFTRTLFNLLTIDPGFDQDVLFVEVLHRDMAGSADSPARQLRSNLQEQLAAIPGVAGVVGADNMMLTGGFWNEFVLTDAGTERALANFARVGGDFFDVLGVRVIKGRTFTRQDTPQSPAVGIVNETFVRKVLKGADPIGLRLWVETAPDRPIEKIEIIGVSTDTKYSSLREEYQPLVYVAESQSTEFGALARYVVKPRGDIAGLTASVERTVTALNPSMTVRMRVIRQNVSNGLVRERLMAALSGAFGVLAAVLAAVGLYGVLSYTVTRRSSEIAIRLAMGAKRSAVLGMVIREAGWLVGIGLVIGTALGLGAARAARSLLFGLSSTDPVTIGGAIALLAAIGFIASYLPARRASRVDPMNVLRQE